MEKAMYRKTGYLHIIIMFCLVLLVAIPAGAYTLRGVVVDAATGEPVDFAGVSLRARVPQSVSTDADGRFRFAGVSGGVSVTVAMVGYGNVETALRVTRDTTLQIRLTPAVSHLREVVVTARESTGMTGGSLIDRAAMQHLQPTSFTDLLELLPGHISKDPDMSAANTITLRETGGVSATGVRGQVSADYAVASLGTSFVVDGMPVNTDANLQALPVSDGTTSARSTVNRGVDMRSLSTDNIESVEVLRGIPSAEYGNLTSGVVNIRRIRRPTPLTARFKADQFSKLFSVGKGFALHGHEHIINIDGGYLDSKTDPRDNLENFRRGNASVRGNFRWTRPWGLTELNVTADYAGTFDNSKVDPDLNLNKVDEYKSDNNRYAFATTLKLTPARGRIVRTVSASFNAAYEPSRLERRSQVAPQRASIAPTSMSAGVHDGRYLLSEYIADFVSDGKPLTMFAKVRADGQAGYGLWLHDYKGGLEWQFAKNYGHGQIYDLTKPLSAAWTTRPRDFSDIPALNTVSAFVEDNITMLVGADKLELQPGVRAQMFAGLDGRYRMSGRVYADPRINVRWSWRPFTVGGSPLRLTLGAGWGTTTKMPTVDYLFPQLKYTDFIQLNYYDVSDPERLSRVSLRTYINDPTNYNLRPARNNKWEVRLSSDWAGNEANVTFFSERMRSGFRYRNIYSPFTFDRYDAGAIDAGALTAPPSLEGLPYETVSVLSALSTPDNGTRIDKRGVEFQLSTARWQPLRTRLIVSGGWFRTTYTNSQRLQQSVTDVVGNVPVSDRYVGVYDDRDGRVNDQFSTNFTFDTQIPRWGLLFTTSVQCQWWLKTKALRRSGVPVAYISYIDGLEHEYTAADAAGQTDPLLAYLTRRYNDAAFNQFTVPLAMYVNFKATKQIGRWLRLSAFVNRIIDYLPDYKSNGLTIRRTSDAYFGMEINLTL